MAHSDWDAKQYLKFNDERNRPARDLLAQIPLSFSPKHIVDLGCGPGNSTALLAERWPNAKCEGIDSSPNMIKKAREALPGVVDFSLHDLHDYAPPPSVDLLFSNAVFHWLHDRVSIMKRLIQAQPSGGVFAFQVPDNLQAPSHLAMKQTAEEGPWAKTMKEVSRADMETPQELYDELKPLCSSVNIWHTNYYHVLENHEAIVEWVKSTGLKPYLDSLSSEDQRSGFIKAYLARLRQAYPVSKDGKVILRYPRLFVVAIRS